MRRTLWKHLGGSGSHTTCEVMPWIVRLLLLLPLTWCTTAVANTGDSAPGQFYIQRDGDHLTVLAREVPQQELLEALAERLDFQLVLMGPLPQPRSLHIEGRPWEQALKQVLSPASWALKYARVAGEDWLVQVVVFPSAPHPPSERGAGHGPVDLPPPPLAEAEWPEGSKADQAELAEPVDRREQDPFGQSPQKSQHDRRDDYDKSATSQ